MDGSLWVFGYGSLLWDPGFPVAQARVGRVTGWQRSFCMRSIHHRGTVDAPGLVLALDQAEGAHCTGLALQVAMGAEDATIATLRERELISSAYLETRLTVDTDEGSLLALCYVIDPHHAQYCRLDLEDQARIIASAAGGRGPNRDYLWATAAHLADLGLADPDLDWLADRVRQLV